jgi:hypothetical protein
MRGFLKIRSGSGLGRTAHEKWLRKSEPLLDGTFSGGAETKEAISQTLDSQASKPGIGQVAVAYRNAGAGHQQPIDGGHDPAEQGG